MKKVRTFLWKGVTTGTQAFKFTSELEPKLTWIIGLLTLVGPILSYGISVVTSVMANKIQGVAKFKSETGITSVMWFIIGYAVMMMASDLFNRWKKYADIQWKHRVNYGVREREREKRYRLDVGMLKSEKFETLVRRIREAPFGWNILVELSVDQFEIISSSVGLIASAWIVIHFSWKLAIFFVVLSTPQFVMDMYFGKLQWKLRGERAVRGKRKDEALSCFMNIRSIVETWLFKSAPFLNSIITSYEEQWLGEIKKIEFKRLWLGIIIDSLFILCVGYCIYATVMAALRGEILIGTMMLVILSGFTGLRSNLRMILNQINQQYEMGRYLDDVMTYFNLKPLLEVPNNPRMVPTRVPPIIEFRDVWFKYDHEKEFALRGLNLTIYPGEKIGVFGENGSGKSTLVALLGRFYHPNKGDIYINRVNLKDVDADTWTEVVSVLMQDVSNYNFTVREAIGIGNIKVEPTDEKLDMVTEFARANEVIKELPEGYDTQLGQSQGGRDLSGGQYKRLAIARRMFAERPLIIMDEPENKLDAKSKETLFKQLNALPTTTTALYVSHDLETLGLAERILVFHKGELVEDGSGEELIRNPDSLYRKAVEHAFESMTKRLKPFQQLIEADAV